MKYIKLFETHAAYAAYIGGGEKILPNVSYCENENEVHYNPYTDPRLIAKYNVEDDSVATMIYGGMDYDGISVLDNFTKIEVDGVEISLTDLDEDYGMYQLSEGEHTIRYTLSAPTEIGYAVFVNCSGLTSITIPNSVTTIGNMAFSYCSGLTSITVESGNTIYDSRNNCNAIIETATNKLIAGCQNTVIPNSVTSIGNGAFSGCTGLTSITIPNSVTTIGQHAFEECTSLTSITIPSSVTSISYGAFLSCSGLTSITIPNSVTSIGGATFGYCTGLTSITIPNSVTSIDNEAFLSCSGLTSITIPDSVTTIGDGAFYNCTGLTNITSLAMTAPTIQNNTFQMVKSGGTLTVPSGSTGYDVWMGTGNYYLGKYNWTKVEQ